MSNNNLLDFKLLRQLKSLRDSRTKVQALGRHIIVQKEAIEAINKDLARNVELQRIVNKHLMVTVSKYRKPTVAKAQPARKAGHLIVVK